MRIEKGHVAGNEIERPDHGATIWAWPYDGGEEGFHRQSHGRTAGFARSETRPSLLGCVRAISGSGFMPARICCRSAPRWSPSTTRA